MAIKTGNAIQKICLKNRYRFSINNNGVSSIINCNSTQNIQVCGKHYLHFGKWVIVKQKCKMKIDHYY